MSIPDINLLRDDLLVELARRRANNRNPGHVLEICAALRPEIDWASEYELSRSAGWLLVRSDPRLAKIVNDSDRPGAMFLALTAAGKSRASEIASANRPKPLWQRIQDSNWAMWSVVIAAFALVAYVVIEIRKP